MDNGALESWAFRAAGALEDLRDEARYAGRSETEAAMQALVSEFERIVYGGRAWAEAFAHRIEEGRL